MLGERRKNSHQYVFELNGVRFTHNEIEFCKEATTAYIRGSRGSTQASVVRKIREATGRMDLPARLLIVWFSYKHEAVPL